MTFNAEGKVTELSSAFVLDRRYGTTKELSAVYAVFDHVGLHIPFPEGRPWEPSAPLKLFQEVTFLTDKLSSFFSKDSNDSVTLQDDEAPVAWWREESKDRLYSKPKNEWAVPPIQKDI